MYECLADYHYDLYAGCDSGIGRGGIRDQVKVMIGGAPVSQGFADEIGADGYSDNANTAVAVAKVLMGKRD